MTLEKFYTIVLLTIALIFFWAFFAMGATLTVNVEWQYPVAAEAGITHFAIYDKDNKVVLDNIGKTARQAAMVITLDGKNSLPFYMKAVDASNPAAIEYSDPSNIYAWTPPKRDIFVPEVFRQR